MNSQIATAITDDGEGDTFNFDNWIIKHDLISIKDLFVKHNATTLAILINLSSPQLQALMIDHQLLSKPQMLIKIMNGVQTLLVTTENDTSKPSILKVIISEKEQLVINTIEASLESLYEMEVVLNSLSEEYPKSLNRINSDKLEKIEIAIQKTNKIFDGISDAINNKRENVLSKLNTMKSQINNDSYDKDDDKESDIISNTQNRINETRELLQEQAKLCDELTSSNEKRNERKMKMLNIGKSVTEKYGKTQKILNENIAILNKSIKCNEDAVVNIDFVTNQKKYNKIMEYIDDVGIIINKMFQKSEINKIFTSSILTATESNTLLSLLTDNGKIFSNKRWNLLYRSSEDLAGLNRDAFVNAVHGKPNIFCVIHSANNNVCGGYTSTGWKTAQSHCSYSRDDEAFLFGIRSSNAYPPMITNVKKETANHALCYQNGMYCMFASQLFIVGSNGYVCHNDNNVYDEFPNKYQLFGVHAQKVTEMEAFQLT
eukprot:175894_1